MENQIHNSESPELHLELYDTDKMPSLHDFMLELEAEDDGRETADRSAAPSPEEAAEVSAAQPVVAVSGNGAAAAPVAAAAANSALAAEAEMAQSKVFLLEQENEELREALLSVQANFDKYRWRTDRDRSENYTFAVIAVVKELLPVLDNFGRALDNAEKLLENSDERVDFTQFTSGVRLIEQQIFKVLGNMGVDLVKAVGEPFDPNFHEAVAAESCAETPPNIVIEEVLRGYRIGDKLVRASLVKVST